MENNDKKKKQKIIFVEKDPQQAFPHDTIYALKRHIKVLAKDLEKTWRTPTQLIDTAFAELNVPKPMCYLRNRWTQYASLISYAIEALHDARGTVLESFLKI